MITLMNYIYKKSRKRNRDIAQKSKNKNICSGVYLIMYTRQLPSDRCILDRDG